MCRPERIWSLTNCCRRSPHIPWTKVEQKTFHHIDRYFFGGSINRPIFAEFELIWIKILQFWGLEIIYRPAYCSAGQASTDGGMLRAWRWKFPHFLGEIAHFSPVAKTFENVDILRQNGAFFGGIRVPSSSKLVVRSWPVEPELWGLIFVIFDFKQWFFGQELTLVNINWLAVLAILHLPSSFPSRVWGSAFMYIPPL